MLASTVAVIKAIVAEIARIGRAKTAFLATFVVPARATAFTASAFYAVKTAFFATRIVCATATTGRQTTVAIDTIFAKIAVCAIQAFVLR